MNRRHALVIALALAVALVAGAFAALRTTALGAQTAASVPDADIAARSAELDRLEDALAQQAQASPPALPPLPRAAPAGDAVTVAARPSRQGVRVPATDDDDHGRHRGRGGGDDHDDDHGEDDDDHDRGDDHGGRGRGGDDDRGRDDD